MGWGAAGVQAGRSVKAIPKEWAASELRSWQLHRSGGSRTLSEERHGLAEKISLTREGRMWQGEPGSSTRVNCVSQRPRDQPEGPLLPPPRCCVCSEMSQLFSYFLLGFLFPESQASRCYGSRDPATYQR